MLRSGDPAARVEAASDVDFASVQRASARAYAVGYGVAALGVHTIVVMGHTKCGAVGATVAGKDLPGKMPAFVAAIKPAIAGLPKGADGKASVSDAEIANVRWQAGQLVKNSEILSKAKADGKLDVLCAIYDVETGAVRFLD